MIGLMALAVSLFVSTNIDDFFILVGLFAEPSLRKRQIALGQFLGIATLFGVSLAASRIALLLPMSYVGLLGLFPIGIGLYKLKSRGSITADPLAPIKPTEQRNSGKVAAVALVTIANGGDNISSYTPVFALNSLGAILEIGIVFAGMTALVLWLAHFVAYHPRLGAPIRKHAPRLMPFILMALGVSILKTAGTFRLLF